MCKVGIRRGWNGATENARRREKRKCMGKRKCGRHGKAEMRKARESGNTEGAGKQKHGKRGKAETWKAQESGKAECDRIVGRWMNGRVTERQTEGRNEGQTEERMDGMYCAGVKDLASAYVLCPRLTEQCVVGWVKFKRRERPIFIGTSLYT